MFYQFLTQKPPQPSSLRKLERFLKSENACRAILISNLKYKGQSKSLKSAIKFYCINMKKIIIHTKFLKQINVL